MTDIKHRTYFLLGNKKHGQQKKARIHHLGQQNFSSELNYEATDSSKLKTEYIYHKTTKYMTF